MLLFSVTEEEQTGELYVPAKLPTLDSDQLRSLSMAKKYCHDVTTKYVGYFDTLYMLIFPFYEIVYFSYQQTQRHSEQQVGQMHALQDAANQQRALLLMSR